MILLALALLLAAATCVFAVLSFRQTRRERENARLIAKARSRTYPSPATSDVVPADADLLRLLAEEAEREQPEPLMLRAARLRVLADILDGAGLRYIVS
jgi:hypothetical protein